MWLLVTYHCGDHVAENQYHILECVAAADVVDFDFCHGNLDISCPLEVLPESMGVQVPSSC